jgi:hypothetical protein
MRRFDHQYEESHASSYRLCYLSSKQLLISHVHHLTLTRKVRFALSSVTSWRSVDGDFDYEVFWSNIVDFFEDVPGPVTRRKVENLLEWWTRYGLRHFFECSDS